jgi:hypothetical protein
MAQALECPACGARHRLDSLPDSPTFKCDRCGQTLKAPVAVSSEPGAPPPPARRAPASSTGAPAPVAPPPRRATPTGDGATATRTAPVASAAAVSATVSATERPDADAGRDAKGPRRAPAAPVTRAKVHWYWRLLAWVVAVPLGFVLTAWPAYEFGFIKKDDLLNIFVGTGTGRYVRLAIVTLVWALVTALLVQLFVEGGRARANRRRRARAVTA